MLGSGNINISCKNTLLFVGNSATSKLTRRGNRVTRLFHFPALHFSAIEFGDLESQRQENDGQED
jgi:hypothetical protein